MVFAALNSMEPHLQNFAELDAFSAKEEWAKLRRPSALEMAQGRLTALAGWASSASRVTPRAEAGAHGV